MPVAPPSSLVELLLLRGGLVFLETVGRGGDLGPASAVADHRVRGFELELANLGYVASTRLRARALTAAASELAQLRDQILAANRKATGGHRQLEPMFRRFPEGIPDDTLALWWDRVIVHYLQRPEQPCVLCCRVGTTHVLNPCMHLVCERCFDGRNYGGCPICNRSVDRSSPFFQPPPRRPASAPAEVRTFALLDLGNPDSAHTMETASRELFGSLCLRTQVMSPVDVDALLELIEAWPRQVLTWLPAKIPVRENLALVFGTLLRGALGLRQAAARGPSVGPPVGPPIGPSVARLAGPSVVEIFQVARAHLGTATDVLRLIAVISGAPVALSAEDKVVRADGPGAAQRFGKRAGKPGVVVISHHRFKVARLPRALRRELLAILDGIPAPQLLEDLLRHSSRWSWVAEFLHPGEYASRFANVAQVFAILRNGPAAEAQPLRAWPSAVELALAQHATGEALRLLAQRPGELLRRFDLLLRRAEHPEQVVATLASVLDRVASPALVALRAHLAVRAQPLAARVFWPKSKFCVPVPPVDRRPSLPPSSIEQLTPLLDGELLRRFAAKPAFETAILDDALGSIMVPFNERTASRSAVQLARGSKLAIADAKLMRLFLHWCEPPGSVDTDLDLSVGFFDDAWNLVGTCSYYQLTAKAPDGRAIARSSGDFTSAPWPEGASEFVDFDRQLALACGYRYAVMVVNAYSGLPFRALPRATAGVMLRDEAFGDHFDPTAVALAFALDGEHGVFMPLVVDLQSSELHWLDAYSKGQFAHNNVASSQRSIGRICPAMISYFASGTRPSMLELGRYHAAARCRRVILRGAQHRLFIRGDGESPLHFLHRLSRGAEDQLLESEPTLTEPVLALLLRGDLAVPEGSASYALFRQQLIPTLAAADLLT